jgi:hypothetical protein
MNMISLFNVKSMRLAAESDVKMCDVDWTGKTEIMAFVTSGRRGLALADIEKMIRETSIYSNDFSIIQSHHTMF